MHGVNGADVGVKHASGTPVSSQRVREQRIDERLQNGALALAMLSDIIQPDSTSNAPCHGCLELDVDAYVGDQPWHRLCGLFWKGRSDTVRSEPIPHSQPGPGLTPARARWVIVVPMGRAESYASIRRRFGRSPWVDVVIDRRRGERRQHQGQAARERRTTKGERRTTERGNVLSHDLTGEPLFRLADQVDGCDVYEAITPETAACPDCGVVVSFELPRFASPPIRLELVVRHEETERRPRHFGELQSLSVTGRLLLSTRLLGRIRTHSR